MDDRSKMRSDKLLYADKNNTLYTACILSGEIKDKEHLKLDGFQKILRLDFVESEKYGG